MAILTISRQFASGSRDIREAIIKSMGYVFFDRHLLLDEMRVKGGQWEKWSMEFDQTSPHIWELYDRSFQGFGALIQSIMLNHALKDNVGLTGRGGNFLLEGIPHAYRIRIISPTKERVERLFKRDAMDCKNARSLAAKVDKERAGFVYALYHKDVASASNYDKVYDTGKHSVEEIVAHIKNVLIEKDALKTETAVKILGMRALAAKVKAGIITDPRLYIPIFNVNCVGNELVLKGVVRTPNQKKAIAETARKIAGDTPVRVELRFRATPF